MGRKLRHGVWLGLVVALWGGMVTAASADRVLNAGEFTALGLEIVAVNFRDDGDTDAYVKRHGLDFDVVLDGDALAVQIGVTDTPTVFVLDRGNRIQLRSSNSDPADPILGQVVASAMEKQPISSPVDCP